jgi:hypothetical protein
MSAEYAKYRLSEWGRWSRDRSSGYPSQWAVAGGASVRASDPLLSMPLHIARVDVIVRQMNVEPRKVVIAHYTQSGPGRDKALRLGMAKTTYFRWLDAGVWHVHIELDYSERYDALEPVGQKMLQTC